MGSERPGRRNLVPLAPPPAERPDLGRAIHEALGIYYFPGMWDWQRQITLPLVLQGLDRALATQREHNPGAGRIGMLAVDADDACWIVRHRVLDGGWTPTETLLADEEMVTACWAWEQFYLGMTITGTIDNELRTGSPPAGGSEPTRPRRRPRQRPPRRARR